MHAYIKASYFIKIDHWLMIMKKMKLSLIKVLFFLCYHMLSAVDRFDRTSRI